MEEAVFFAPIFTFSVIFQNAAVWAREDTSAPILNTLTNISMFDMVVQSHHFDTIVCKKCSCSLV